MADFTENLYVPKERIYVCIECSIFGFDSGTLKLLIFKRPVEPLFGQWSLIGSFVKFSEDVEEAAQRVLKEVTGLENVFMEEMKAYIKVDCASESRCISIAQYAFIRINDCDKALVEEQDAHWYEIGEIPDLILDQNQLVQDALLRIRRTARYKPIAFELLPKKFTIPQVQRLYEAIYQKELDRRNFKKKILSLDILVKLDEKYKSCTGQAAYLYNLDCKRYQELLKIKNKLNII